MVKETFDPEDPLSKEHWLNSFGTASVIFGGRGATSSMIDHIPSDEILNENLIYITSGENYCEDKVYFYSYEAKSIMSYFKDTSQVCWQYNGNLIVKQLDYINQANIYKDLDIIIVLTGQKKDKKLIIYKIDGSVICEKEEEKNYYFSHLTSDGDKPAIVCDGDEKTKDKYGRNTWKFSINPITGELIKLSLAY